MENINDFGGWKNEVTRRVALWLDNDYRLYTLTKEAARIGGGNEIAHMVTGLYRMEVLPGAMIRELCEFDLIQVDWDALAEHALAS